MGTLEIPAVCHIQDFAWALEALGRKLTLIIHRISCYTQKYVTDVNIFVGICLPSIYLSVLDKCHNMIMDPKYFTGQCGQFQTYAINAVF